MHRPPVSETREGSGGRQFRGRDHLAALLKDLVDLQRALGPRETLSKARETSATAREPPSSPLGRRVARRGCVRRAGPGGAKCV
jgi:hypothetical protein